MPNDHPDERDGGAAFGHAAENGHCHGMSLRDWFAGQALPMIQRGQLLIAQNGGDVSQDTPATAAQIAYEMADAMLKARDAK